MSRNLLDHARENRDMLTLKSAFQSIGCNCDFDDIEGAAEVIKNLSTVPTVFNATLMSGPGIKVTPIERKGYKVSANDEAPLYADINGKYRRGTSIHNVLSGIVNRDIPEAIKTAVRAPRVSDIEVFRVYEDGIDYYNNPYFGSKGQGRKGGLQPCAWYIKIYTISQIEPLYVCLAAIVEGLRVQIIEDVRRMVDKMVVDAVSAAQIGEPNDPDSTLKPEPEPTDYHYQPGYGPAKPCRPCHDHHRPHKPHRPKPIVPDFPEEPTGPVIYEQPIDPNEPIISYDDPTGCPICDEDKDFGGFAGDNDFLVNILGED